MKLHRIVWRELEIANMDFWRVEAFTKIQTPGSRQGVLLSYSPTLVNLILIFLLHMESDGATHQPIV